MIVLVQLHGDLAVGHDVGEIGGQSVAANIASGGGEYDKEVAPIFLVFRQGHQGGDRPSPSASGNRLIIALPLDCGLPRGNL